MKRVIVIYFFFSVFCSFAQSIEVIELMPPDSNEITDLNFLKKETKGKNVIMLGEQTHMYGNIFEMKARIVEYLHQELGYTTIAIESPMYDIWKMNLTGFDPKTFNESVWGVWSSTYEFQRLVKYINNNNLKVIGFDSQVNNVSQFIDDFFDYLEKVQIDLKLDEDDLAIVIEAVLEIVSVEEDDISYKNYEKELKRIIAKIEKLEQTDENFHWLQFTKSLLAGSQDAYHNKDEILTSSFLDRSHNIRDKQMADNLLSYINRNPNEKIICWADNIHVMNDNSSITKPIAKDFISMGSYIFKALKGKSYSLATLHANDTFVEPRTNQKDLTPIKENSFEYELNILSKPYLFVSSSQEKMQVPKETRLYDYVDFSEARLDQLHDGYIFFQKATLPKAEKISDSVKMSNKALTLEKKIELVQVGQNIVLKGQLLDKDTKDIVPFATLVVKNKNIYRVANENGYFELSVNKSIMQSAVLEISSLGFETTEIPLKNLTERIYLKPKFEELDEVVIKAYLSPLAVLKKAVKKKSENHPVEPFNFYRYAKVKNNVNDEIYLDVELYAKQYDDGYTSKFRITHNVQEVKWNVNKSSDKFTNAYQLFSTRENAIRYSNVLHKRKYKKFNLRFVKSDNIEGESNYIIAFKTERNKWNYTNRGYPTKYSGRVYIDKQSFAVLKVIEHWETHLNQEEVEKYLSWRISGDYKDVKDIIIKEEQISQYESTNIDNKYYATKFFTRQYFEIIDKRDKKSQQVKERDSYFFDFETENVEEIKYEQLEIDKSSLLKSEYNKAFWSSFRKRIIDNN